MVGTGPSLYGFDFGRLRGPWRVLAVKQAYHDLPFAEACFGLDLPWMRHHADELAELAARMPLYLTVPDQEIDIRPVAGAVFLKRTGRCDRFSDDLGTIEAGGNSGFGALNFAYLKRAKKIVLFGYDYGGSHYCEDRYVTRPKDQNARYLPSWATNYRRVIEQLTDCGTTVINASPRSAVDAFTKCTIDEGLEHLRGCGPT